LFLGSYLSERLVQHCVSIMLTSGGLGDGLLCGSKLRGKLRAIAAVRFPRYEDAYGQDNGDKNLCELQPYTQRK
jgi:hypothetical protein